MKNLWQLSLVFLLPAFIMVACGKKEENNNTTATAPNNTCVVNYCDNSIYSNYAYYGFSAYNIPAGMSYSTYISQYGYTSGSFGSFCSCGYGNYPVYNGTFGFGCVSQAAVAPMLSFAATWTLQPNNYQWTSMPQYSNNNFGNGWNTGWNSSYYGGWNSGWGNTINGSCTNRVLEACYTNQPNACADGRICRPTQNGSPIGICTIQ